MGSKCFDESWTSIAETLPVFVSCSSHTHWVAGLVAKRGMFFGHLGSRGLPWCAYGVLFHRTWVLDQGPKSKSLAIISFATASVGQSCYHFHQQKTTQFTVFHKVFIKETSHTSVTMHKPELGLSKNIYTPWEASSCWANNPLWHCSRQRQSLRRVWLYLSIIRNGGSGIFSGLHFLIDLIVRLQETFGKSYNHSMV